MWLFFAAAASFFAFESASHVDLASRSRAVTLLHKSVACCRPDRDDRTAFASVLVQHALHIE